MAVRLSVLLVGPSLNSVGEAVMVKKKSYWALVAGRTLEAVEEYRQAKKATGPAVADAKAWMWFRQPSAEVTILHYTLISLRL